MPPRPYFRPLGPTLGCTFRTSNLDRSRAKDTEMFCCSRICDSDPSVECHARIANMALATLILHPFTATPTCLPSTQGGWVSRQTKLIVFQEPLHRASLNKEATTSLSCLRPLGATRLPTQFTLQCQQFDIYSSNDCSG